MALVTERDRVAHLLRRAGFGVSRAELDEYAALGVEGSVDRLLSTGGADYHLPTPGGARGQGGRPLLAATANRAQGRAPSHPAGAVGAQSGGIDDPGDDSGLSVWELTNPKNGGLNPNAVGGWWAYKMLVTPTPLVEKMTLFWHDHFGCSAEKVKAGPLMYQHCQLLRSVALGNFGELLRAVARDPTMLVFLDGGENVAAHPNENFARELMELYTMGIGNYTEKDVQEGARALTGWRVERPGALEYVVDPHPLPSSGFVAGQHDNGTKTYLGHTGNLNGDDVLDIVLHHPATAKRISKKLWESFAYYNPDDNLVASLAHSFAQSGFSTGALLRQIFLSPQFYSEKAERALYKSPADFVVGTLRSSGVGPLIQQRLAEQAVSVAMMTDEDVAAQAKGRLYRPIAFIVLSMANMGQHLLFPPSVKGWDGGSAWVNSATMVERIKFANVFAPEGLAEARPNKGKVSNGGNGARGRIPAQLVLGGAPLGSVADGVSRVATVLDAPLPPEKLAVISSAVQEKVANAFTAPEDRQKLAYQAARLIFASPEYQFM